MQKMMYLLVSQHVSGIITPIIRRMVQNRQRLWFTALVVLQKTRGEEVVGVHLLGMVSPFPTIAHQPPLLLHVHLLLRLVGYLFTFMIQDAHEIKIYFKSLDIFRGHVNNNTLDVISCCIEVC
jgi:hypothetical protein